MLFPIFCVCGCAVDVDRRGKSIRAFAVPILRGLTICSLVLCTAWPARGQSAAITPTSEYSAVDCLIDRAPEAFGAFGQNLAMFEKSAGLQIVNPTDGTVVASLGEPGDYIAAHTVGSTVNVWSSFVAADPSGNSLWVGFNTYNNTDDKIYQVDRQGNWTPKATLTGNWDMEFHGNAAYLTADTSGMGAGDTSIWKFNTTSGQLVDVAHVGGYSAGLGVDAAGNVYYGTYGFVPGNQSLYRFSAQQISIAASSGTPLELGSAAKLADFADAYGPYDLDVDAAGNVVFNLNGATSSVALWSGVQGGGANYSAIGTGEGSHWYSMLATVGNVRQPGGIIYMQDYYSPGIVQITRLANPWGGGSSADNHWTTPENWAVAAAPVLGDALIFSGTTQLTAQNDFTAGTPFYGITFTASAGGFGLSGNKITLLGDIVNQSPNAQSINLDVDLGGNIAFDAQSGDIIVSGTIDETDSGCGVVKKGPGALTLSGILNYTGDTVIEDGSLKITPATADLHAISGQGELVVGGGAYSTTLTVDSINLDTLTLGAGATLVIRAIPGGPTADAAGITPVPEPGTGATLLLAALGLLLWPRKSTAHGVCLLRKRDR
jgi:autotransporter-associated beta strand protein